MLRSILWLLLLLPRHSIAEPTVTQTGWKLARPAATFDRYYLTDPHNLAKIRTTGNLAGAATGRGHTNVMGWFEYDFRVPQTGWYKLFTGFPSGDVEFIIDPASREHPTNGLYIYGSNGSNGNGDKIGNIWLTVGKHTLRIQRYIWTGFPPIPNFTIQSSDSSLVESIRASLSSPRTIYRKNECPSLDIYSGKRFLSDKLTINISDTTSGALLTTSEVRLPVSHDLVNQQIPVYCQTEGNYTISFGDSSGHRFDKRDVREINYEVIDTNPLPRGGGHIAKTLVQEIDCSTTAPDYYGGATTRVVHKAFGSYRESGDVGWVKYELLKEPIRKLAPEPSWFAYKLKVTTTQRPYLIEVDYPDDKERTFAIALRESNPLSYPVASGIDSGGEFSLSNKILTHFVIYWPRAAGTRLVFMTGYTGRPAAAAKIRVYQIDGDLPALDVPVNGGRNFMNWYEEGNNFTSLFGAPDLSPVGFRVATERWAKTVDYIGGSVLSPTAVIYNFASYPSEYNRTFSTPSDNDILRRMLLISEKYEMKLLPELHPRADELAWPYVESPDPKPNLLVSNDGKTLNNLPPHYNPLYPANQDWYIGMIGELVDNYRDSPALLGVSLRLMQWQNPTLNNFHSLDWGYDDYTIGLFQKETGLTVPGAPGDAARFRKRYEWLMANARERWISWRCDKIAQLYTRIRDRVREARPDLKVFSSVFDGYDNYPKDFGTSWLRGAGIDTKILSRIDGVVLVNALHAYGRRDNREDDLVIQTVRDNLLSPDVLHSMIKTNSNGVFLSYSRYFEALPYIVPPQELGFPATTKRTMMSAVINPAGTHYLERYAVQLAETDASWLGDGGNGYTIGQPNLRDFLKEYRSLPPVSFVPRQDARDPVAVWELQRSGDYLFYAVNRERFPVTVQLRLRGSGQVYRLSTGQKMIPQKNILSLQLQPYQLIAFKASKGVSITGVATKVPAEDLRRVTTQVQWLEALNHDVQSGHGIQILPDTQRQILTVAATQARIALSQNHVWRARTIMENHALLSVYKDIGRYPPDLRNETPAYQ